MASVAETEPSLELIIPVVNVVLAILFQLVIATTPALFMTGALVSPRNLIPKDSAGAGLVAVMMIAKTAAPIRMDQRLRKSRENNLRRRIDMISIRTLHWSILLQVAMEGGVARWWNNQIAVMDTF
jgi:hypothetical protein